MSSEMKIKLVDIQGWLFYFLVFFVVFDGMRSNMIISGLVSPFRELALNLFIICCAPMLIACKKRDFRIAIPFLCISLLAIVNIPITLFNNIADYKIGNILIFENKYSAIYKHIIFSLLFLSLICFARKNLDKMTKGLGMLINLAAFYSVITIPIYLYGFPLFVEKFRDWGRMGVGYPTMDGQMICFAIFCLIFLVPQKSKMVFNLKMACLLIGIIAQNTGTAMVTMAVLAMAAFVKKPGKTTSYFVFIVPLVAAVVIQQYYSNPQFFTEMLFIANNKINQILNPELTANVGDLDTLQMRVVQYEMINNIMERNILFRLFGVGGQAYIENEFKLTLAAYGIFSFACFVFSFLWISVLSIMSKNRNKFLILIIMVIWGFTSYTLSSIHLFTTSFCFSMVFAYTYVSGSLSKKEIDTEEIMEKKNLKNTTPTVPR
ncbi:hypothetical protein PTQ50_06565 [Klebsiella michiganensis]|uniref:hypothetical protein n=1 Tax=Klebsiella michiganensis TaxID=1134687 RepID=UPI0015F38B6D|nr:hypothetical protein [Klebsiella michiganensis]MBA8051381.1 hypothetical protein [Klebsiella michiganensis]MBZ7209199.1 hypothetical protein [Klebsiella michiganensis]MDI3220797.1 hypothetical protein [Klebsiella michiganensis]MDS7838768.1 hypothetical protein [Klebsiella michiganensis]MDS7852401.1 hypothetical protein [Klebsiella michiganensis]